MIAFWQKLWLDEMTIAFITEGTSEQSAGQAVQQILVASPPGHNFGQQEGSTCVNACNYTFQN